MLFLNRTARVLILGVGLLSLTCDASCHPDYPGWTGIVRYKNNDRFSAMIEQPGVTIWENNKWFVQFNRSDKQGVVKLPYYDTQYTIKWVPPRASQAQGVRQERQQGAKSKRFDRSTSPVRSNAAKRQRVTYNFQKGDSVNFVSTCKSAYVTGLQRLCNTPGTVVGKADNDPNKVKVNFRKKEDNEWYSADLDPAFLQKVQSHVRLRREAFNVGAQVRAVGETLTTRVLPRGLNEAGRITDSTTAGSSFVYTVEFTDRNNPAVVKVTSIPERDLKPIRTLTTSDNNSETTQVATANNSNTTVQKKAGGVVLVDRRRLSSSVDVIVNRLRRWRRSVEYEN